MKKLGGWEGDGQSQRATFSHGGRFSCSDFPNGNADEVSGTRARLSGHCGMCSLLCVCVYRLADVPLICSNPLEIVRWTQTNIVYTTKKMKCFVKAPAVPRSLVAGQTVQVNTSRKGVLNTAAYSDTSGVRCSKMSYIPDGSETDKVAELQTHTAGPSRVMKYGINIPLKPEQYFQQKEAHSSPGKTHPELHTAAPLCSIQGCALFFKVAVDVG